MTIKLTLSTQYPMTVVMVVVNVAVAVVVAVLIVRMIVEQLLTNFDEKVICVVGDGNFDDIGCDVDDDDMGCVVVVVVEQNELRLNKVDCFFL